MYSADELRDRNRSQEVSESDPFTEDRYRQFARFIEPGWSVLDVGCNTGRGGSALLGVVPGVVLDGNDFLPERLAEIPPGVYRELTSDSLASLLDRGRVYDAVVAGEVVEHVPYASLDAFLAELLTLVRPGGRILLTTPNPHSLLSRVLSRSVLGGAHVSVHCATALREHFEYLGAESCRVLGSGKSSRYLGMRMPTLLYGSYLMVVETRASDTQGADPGPHPRGRAVRGRWGRRSA